MSLRACALVRQRSVHVRAKIPNSEKHGHRLAFIPQPRTGTCGKHVAMKRVVVVGGSGLFGSRVARGLARLHPGTEVVVTSRSGARAREAAVFAGPEVRHAALDLGAGEGASRARAGILQGASVVVNAAGPWGEGGLELAREACRAGAHYVDMADCREYVARFEAAVGPDAMRAGVTAVTGASTSPALSVAAVRRAEEALGGRARAASVVISGALRTPFGAGTVASVLRYAGEPFLRASSGPLPEHGHARGWRGLRWESFRGVVERRLTAEVRTPCLDALPCAAPGLKSVRVSAGVGHALPVLGMWLASFLPRPVLRALVERGAPAMARAWAWAVSALPAGGSADVGAMKVLVVGEQHGRPGPAVYEWSLRSEGGDGLEAACAPAVLMASRLLEPPPRRAPPPAGAYTPAQPGLLSLREVERYLERAGVRVWTSEHVRDFRSPFSECVGTRDASRMSPWVRLSHSEGGRFSGELEVVAPSWRRQPLAALACLAAGLPPSSGGRRLPVSVVIEPRAGSGGAGSGDELVFLRSVGGRSLVSSWSLRHGAIFERFRADQRFGLSAGLLPSCGGFFLRGRALGLPLQRVWPFVRVLAESETSPRADDPRVMDLDVRATLPLLSLRPLFGYRGTLRVDSVWFPREGTK